MSVLSNSGKLLCAALIITAISCTTRQSTTEPPPVAAILQVALPASAAATDDASWQRIIATHVTLIPDKTMILQAVDASDGAIAKTKWYSRFKTPAEAADWLHHNLHAAQVPNTALIKVWIGGDIDAKDAAIISDCLAAQYVENTTKLEQQRLAGQVSLLTGLRSKYENRVRALKTEVSQVAGKLQLDTRGKSGVTTAKEHESYQLIALRVDTDLEAAAAKATLEAVRASATPEQIQKLTLEEASAQRKVELINKQLERVKRDLDDLAFQLSLYSSKQDELESQEELLRKVMQQLDALSTLAQHSGMGRITVIPRLRM